jgi:hypothetical protein
MWVTGRHGNALQLDGTTGYVSMPVGVAGAISAFTIAAWVRPDTDTIWQRLFDFGVDPTSYMFLTTSGPARTLHYAITLGSIPSEQILDGKAKLPIGAWSHVAVVFDGLSVEFYVDGAMDTRSDNFSLRPKDLGLTQNNWIGRSQFQADAFLKGTVDDFRIYDQALTADEVARLAAE